MRTKPIKKKIVVSQCEKGTHLFFVEMEDD